MIPFADSEKLVYFFKLSLFIYVNRCYNLLFSISYNLFLTFARKDWIILYLSKRKGWNKVIFIFGHLFNYVFHLIRSTVCFDTHFISLLYQFIWLVQQLHIFLQYLLKGNPCPRMFMPSQIDNDCVCCELRIHLATNFQKY